ncbi:hypothetical protein SAY86_009874 [Trapa natans]|uniref:Pentatricopeptide repeat-containing protein n=1 Tax=Trapa natans TaxID=22666 RepID=A0AAN7KZ85_TRANT|nr:hypothetical protein SAY86_009874 [Trapa natans]
MSRISVRLLYAIPRCIRKLTITSIACGYHSSPSSSFNCLLNSCSSLSSLKRVHALIVLTDGTHPSLFLSTKLVSLACKLSPTMEYARKLFDRMLLRDVFSWNTLIRGYADVGPCREAVLMYRDMHHSRLSPDCYTFPFVVRCCGVISALLEGREVHCNVIKNGFVSDVFVQSSLIAMYAQCGEISCSENVFSEMDVRNVVSWTAMIAGYVQNGSLVDGLTIFLGMFGSGTKPNAITLVSILPACSSLKLLSMGMLIHSYGVKVGLASQTPLLNALVALYGKCGRIEVARTMFDNLEGRNLVTWNAMIAAYEQNNDNENAIKIFCKMQDENVQYDCVTLVSVLSASANLGVLGTGKWLHELAIQKGFEDNVSVTNALINMYAKCGDTDAARNVFERSGQKSVVSWTSMIGACASYGLGSDALDLFSTMKEEGISPSSLTFTTILNACRHAGLVEEGRKHFESMMKDYSIIPGVEQCACMVDLLGRAGCLKEAYEFIERMPIEPDSSIWGALLGACKIHGDVELAELVYNRLFELDHEAVTLYVLMSNIYAEAGRWEDVVRLKELMSERVLKRIPGHSLVEVNQQFHRFLSGLRSQPHLSSPIN